MKTKFLGQAYKSRSPILASQSCINLYAEGSEGNSDEVGAFLGTPGLVAKFQGVVAEVRGLHNATDGNLYAVIGNTVYRIAPGFDAQNLGTIPNSAGPVSITDNGLQVAFAHQSGWHYASFLDISIKPVTNSPSGGSILATQDSYVIFTENLGGEFGITALADLSTIDPLDVATAEGIPDPLISVLSDHREVWLFSTESIEIWTDTGAAFFPFERSPGGFIEMGCAAKRSPTKIDNSVFWLGRDANGHGVVFRANAYIPTRISTHAIEFAINQYADISDAIGISYQEEGHSFYWLIFPSGDSSWVYDVATGGWHQRLWLDDFTGLLHRPRANCFAFFNDMHLVGDWQNGKIYQLSLDIGTDDGVEIYRERAFDLPDSELHRIRLDKIELDALTGDGAFVPGGTWGWDSTSVTFASTTDTFDGALQVAGAPIVSLEISRDNGRSFGFKRMMGLGKIGQRNARARWRRGGLGRNFVLKLSTSMSSRVNWVGCNVEAEALDQ